MKRFSDFNNTINSDNERQSFTGSLDWVSPAGIPFTFDVNKDKKITVNDGFGNFSFASNVGTNSDVGNGKAIRNGGGVIVNLFADAENGRFEVLTADMISAGEDFVFSKLEFSKERFAVSTQVLEVYYESDNSTKITDNMIEFNAKDYLFRLNKIDDENSGLMMSLIDKSDDSVLNYMSFEVDDIRIKDFVDFDVKNKVASFICDDNRKVIIDKNEILLYRDDKHWTALNERDSSDRFYIRLWEEDDEGNATITTEFYIQDDQSIHTDCSIEIKNSAPQIRFNADKDDGIDVQIGADGEDFVIIEPEDGNSAEWLRIKDNDTMYVFGQETHTNHRFPVGSFYTDKSSIDSDVVYPFNLVRVDTHNAMDTDTYKYTIPYDGIYEIQWGGFIGHTEDDVYRYYVYINDSSVDGGTHIRQDTKDDGYASTGAKTIYKDLKAGDTVHIYFKSDDDNVDYGADDYGYFNIKRIH